MQVGSATVSTIIHATEDSARVMAGLASICPNDLHPRVAKKTMKGHYGNEITTVNVTIRGRSAEKFLNNIWTRLSSRDREAIVDELESRLDDKGRFYFRLDKQECARGVLRKKDQDSIRATVFVKGITDSNKAFRNYLLSHSDRQ